MDEETNEPTTPEEHPEEPRNSKARSNVAFAWEAVESSGSQKSGDWYFVLWTLAVAGAVVAVMLGNILFALLVILSAFTLSVVVSKPAQTFIFEISRRGVKAGTTLLPYSSLSAFCIVTLESEDSFLILEPSKPFGLRQVFPIAPDVDIDDLREFLLNYLKEEELDLPLTDKIADTLGV